MFIFCKVKEKGKECLCQAWAVGSPFSQMFKCPVHGLIDRYGKGKSLGNKNENWNSE